MLRTAPKPNAVNDLMIADQFNHEAPFVRCSTGESISTRALNDYIDEAVEAGRIVKTFDSEGTLVLEVV